MIKAICFDLDGLYFLNGKTNFITALTKLGVTESEAIRVFLKSDQMNLLYKEGKLSDTEFWSWALKEWHLKLSVEEIIDLLISGYEVNPPVIKLIKKARLRGYKTLICSNNFPARIEGLHQKFYFLDNFDAASLSYQVGATKPSPKIFEKLIELSGLEPSQILFSDDNQSNVDAAAALGIHTFLYQDFDLFMEELRKLEIEL